MTSPGEDLKRLLHPALFAAWGGYLACLLAGGEYTAFLRPEFGLLLAVALFISICFMIAAIRWSKKVEIETSSILRAVVLLIPIWYSMATPGGMLGNQAFKKRFVGSLNGVAGPQKEYTNTSQKAEDLPDRPLLPEEIERLRNLKPRTPTILDLYNHPENFLRKRVNVTGMILRDETLKPYFEGRDTVLYRFLVTCCTADALPLSIVLESVQTAAMAKDQWVAVDGIFELRQIKGEPVPMILAPEISPIETPATTYLY